MRHLLLLPIFCLFIPLSGNTQSFDFKAVGPGGGGATYAPSISPYNPNRIFLSCDMAGVYRTDNGGVNWHLMPSSELVSQINQKIQFTSDSSICYTIRRSLSDKPPAFSYGEAVKSTDGGLHWQPITDPTSTGAHRLLADPHSTQRLLLNEYDRLFFSTDGGDTWTNIWQPSGETVWLGGAFWDGPDVYAALGQGLLVSHDGGQNWSLESTPGWPAGAGFYDFCGAKAGNEPVFYALSAPGSELYPWLGIRDLENRINGIFKLQYGPGHTWIDLAPQLPATATFRQLGLSLDQPDVVYLGGSDIATNNYAWPRVFKSTDGGQTWINTLLLDANQNLTTGYGGDGGIFSWLAAGSPLALEVSKSDPNQVMFTNFGMPMRSDDGGLNWRQVYVAPAFQHPAGVLIDPTLPCATSGLDITTGWDLHWITQDELLVAGTDIACQHTADGGITWDFNRNVFEPWGSLHITNYYRISQHPGSNRLYAAVGDINDMYLGYRLRDEELQNTTGGILYSDEGGANWKTLYDFGHPVTWVEADPNMPDRMFASVVHHPDGGIFRSLDGGFHWTKLPLPARVEGHPNVIRLLHDGSVVVTCSGRALDGSDTLTASSGVFYSPDGGDTWLDRTDPAMQYFTKEVVIDPHDPSQNTWYATVWGQFTAFAPPNNGGNGGLYRSFDRGLTWSRIFAHERTESIAFNPSVAGDAFITLEMGGLYKGTALSTQAPVFEKIPEFIFPRPKRVFFHPYDPGQIWITTMGGGVWKGNYAVASSVKTDSHQDPIAVFPNPAAELITVDVRNAADLSIRQIRLVNALGLSVLEYAGSGSALETLPVAGVPEGWYVLVVVTNKARNCYPILIHR